MSLIKRNRRAAQEDPGYISDGCESSLPPPNRSSSKFDEVLREAFESDPEPPLGQEKPRKKKRLGAAPSGGAGPFKSEDSQPILVPCPLPPLVYRLIFKLLFVSLFQYVDYY